jgi:ribonuclease E
MSKKMLINASHPEENRVAIVVDGLLSELDIEIAGQEQTKGNIYKAVVARVETGLQAAFVDYGAEKLGFLQIGEIHPSLYPESGNNKSRPRISDILHRGQEILVQVVKEERGTKGAALTTLLSLPGRYMVLMPDSSTKGVSRKINEESERKKLKKTMAELDLPDNMGYIVRTAGIGKDKDELKRDFDYLVRLYEGIVARKSGIKAPAQLYQESNLAIRSIRDYFTTDMDEVLIDNPQTFEDTRDFFALVMPELKHLVKRHRERRPIFSRYQIEEQIDNLSTSKTPLNSGGSIVLDQTEALVAIDVNSGKMSSESGIEATAFKTNLEAASEIGRQLRLRDLGGLIVVDFIDMRDRKNIRAVEQALRQSLKDDKAKVSLGRISQFGLLEMSRQRLKPTLSVGSYIECPHCHGIGRIKSTEAQAVSLLRQIHTVAAKGQVGRVEAAVPIEVANYLHNQKRRTLNELEKQLSLTISIIGRPLMFPGEIELSQHKEEKEEEDPRRIDPVSHANQIEVALAAAQENGSEEQDSAAQPAAEASQTQPENSEKPKKRRRRRRRKPTTESGSADASEQHQGQEAQSKEGSAQATPNAAEHQAESGDNQQETAPEANKKPARRSPSRRKKSQEQATETNIAESSAAAEQETSGSSTDEVTAEPAAKQPNKRTRRPRRKQPTQIPATSENNSQTDAGTETAEPERATAEADQPKPQRKPRRSSAQKAAASEKQEQNSASGNATTEEASQPQRRPRRSTQKKTATDAPTNENAAAATSEGGEAATKPARRPRKSPQKKTAVDVPANENAAAATSEGGEAATKPARRPRRTKKQIETEKNTE